MKFSTLTNWNIKVVRSAGAADGETELRAKRETRRIELRSRMRWIPIQPSSIEAVTKPRVTMGKKLNSGMMALRAFRRVELVVSKSLLFSVTDVPALLTFLWRHEHRRLRL